MKTDFRANASPDIKMMFLIKRKPGTTREQLLAYWFAHHMPGTIKAMGDVARGYIGTVFKADTADDYPWDGVAQMFLKKPLKTPLEGFGARPADSFHELVQPYFGWATREYLVLDGSEFLPVRPLTLNAPFPTTRSGFFKVTHLVKSIPGADHDTLNAYWLSDHASMVADLMRQVGGFHFAVGISLEPDDAPYAGIEEFYFHEPAAWKRYQELVAPDALSQWCSEADSHTLFADTEFVAIPV